MKRTFSLFLCLLLLAGLFSCTPAPQKSPEPQKTPAPQKDVGTGVRGVVADNIYAYLSPDVDYKVFVIEKDGKFGVIDKDGNLLTEPTFDSATLCHTAKNDTEWETANVKVLLQNEGETEGFFVEADGALTKGFCGGFAPHSHYEVYWDSKNSRPAVFFLEEGKVSYVGDDVSVYRHRPRLYTYYADNASSAPQAIVIQAIDGYEITNDFGTERLHVNLTSDEKYALLSLKTGELLTEFIYEDYDRMGMVNHVIALKRNGAWGYVNSLGREITRFGFLPTHTELLWEDGAVREVPSFLPTTHQNYIVLNEGSLYGIVEASEARFRVVSSFYALTLPNSDGWFFAKEKDGTWTAYNLANF